MNKLGNLNADIYVGISRVQGRDRQTIYSTLDNLEIASISNTAELPASVLRVASDKDLHIYANTLTIHGGIEVPGGDILIRARNLIVPKGSVAFLDTTPESLSNAEVIEPATPAPAKAGAKGLSGQAGDYGEDNQGVISLMIGVLICDATAAEEQNAEPKPSLVLRAKGGQGGAGKPGQNGAKGEVGQSVILYEFFGADRLLDALRPAGYTGRMLFIGEKLDESTWAPGTYKGSIPYAGINKLRLAYDADRAQPGGDGGAGGSGGRGGDGGGGGTVNVFMPAKYRHAIKVDVSGGNHGNDGANGEGGEIGEGGVETRYDFGSLRKPSKFISIKEILRKKQADGQRGDNSTSINRVADPGLGEEGFSAISDLADNSMGYSFDSTFLLKLLVRCKNLYFMYPPQTANSSKGEDKYRDEIIEHLGWLLDILKPFSKPNPNASTNAAEHQRKHSILKQAGALLHSYSHGLNIFGKEPSWVPRRALSSYQQDAEALLQPLQKIEDEFKNKIQGAENAAAIDASLANMMQGVEETLGLYEEKMDNFSVALAAAVKPIESASESLGQIATDISRIMDKYEYDIKTYVACKFDLDGVFKALEMVLFSAPHDGGLANIAKAVGPMAGLQAAELIYQTVESLDQINGVKKEYIIQKMMWLDDQVKLTLKGKLQREFGQRIARREDGSLYYDANKYAVLITELEQFEDEMLNFREAFPDAGQELENAIYHLKYAVQMRSDAIVSYNAIISQVLMLHSQLTDLRAKRKEIQEKSLATSDPNRAGTVSYLTSLYQDMRNRAAELVFLTERAKTYWAAGEVNKNSVFSAFQNNELWLDGDLSTDFSAAKLLESTMNIRSDISAIAEDLGRSTRHPDKREMVKSEHFIEIKDAKQIQVFRDQRKLIFTTAIAPAKNSKGEYEVFRTSEYRNIRVMYCRPRLVGVVDKKGYGIKVHVTHLGQETLLRTDGVAVDFIHDTVHADFTYHPDSPPDQEFNSGEDGGFYNVESNDALQQYFALPGLLARWQIDLGDEFGEKDNPGIDLGTLKSINVEFGISFDGKK